MQVRESSFSIEIGDDYKGIFFGRKIESPIKIKQQLGSPDDTEIVDRINLCRMKSLREGESNC